MNYLEFLKYVAKCCQKCIFQTTAFNNTFHAEIFLNCFFVFLSHHLLKILSAKPPGYSSFSFTYVSTGHNHFLNDKIRDSCEPDRPTSGFFSCETAVNTARNACFEVCGESLLTQKSKPPQAKAYLCVSVIFSLYFSYMGYFHQLMICSRGSGKTSKYTNIHAYIHAHAHF